MSDLPASPPLIDAVATRRSLRAFDARPPSDATLRTVFEAARWAPSGGNGQPWRFVVARAGSDGFARLAATLRGGNAWAKAAPVLVLAAVKELHDRPGKPVRPNRRALLDLGLAVQNLLLQAAAEGLTTHPMAGFDAEEAARAVGLPEHHRTGILIALGYPGDPSELDEDVRAKDERPRTRLTLDRIVYAEEFGTPAAFADPAAADDAEAGRRRFREAEANAT